jgi:putative hemolysin
MFITIVRIVILGSLCIVTTAAGAQNIRPECAKMRDKVGCTCALNNGGGISAFGDRWYSVRGRHVNRGGMPNQAFTNCVARGGHN